MVFSGGVIAAVASVAWAGVYALTEQFLVVMPPLSLLTYTYMVGGLVSLIPFFLFESVAVARSAIEGDPFLFGFYIVLVLTAKTLMIIAVKMVGASAAGFVEMSYVSLYSNLEHYSLGPH